MVTGVGKSCTVLFLFDTLGLFIRDALKVRCAFDSAGTVIISDAYDKLTVATGRARVM